MNAWRRQRWAAVLVLAGVCLFVLNLLLGPRIYTDGCGVEDETFVYAVPADVPDMSRPEADTAHRIVLENGNDPASLRIRAASPPVGGIRQRRVRVSVTGADARLLFSRSFDTFVSDAWFCSAVALAFADIDSDGRKEILYRHRLADYPHPGESSILHVEHLGGEPGQGRIGSIWSGLMTAHIDRKLKIAVTPVSPWNLPAFMAVLLTGLALPVMALTALWAPRRVAERLGMTLFLFSVSGLLLSPRLSWLPIAAFACLAAAARMILWSEKERIVSA